MSRELLEVGFDVIEGRHVPTVKVSMIPCGADDMAAWDARDELGRRIGLLLAEHDRYARLELEHAILLAKVEAVEALAKVGELIRDQSNRGTDQPMFAVLEKRETITLDTHHHDRIAWVRKDDGEVEADERTHERLERLHGNGVEPKKWDRYAMLEGDSFVTAAFTEQACIDYLERNGHNLRKPFIYAFGSFRNAEFQMIRDALLALAGPKS